MFAATAALTATVIVEVFAVVAAGSKLTVTPAGAPVDVNWTLPAKPPVRVSVAVDVLCAPCWIGRVPGATPSVNPGCAAAVMVSVRVRV